MNYLVKLTIANDGITKNFIGRIWCEYSTKKVRKQIIDEEVVKIVSKELNVSTVEINWHPEKYEDNFHFLIEDYEESIYDILFSEKNEDTWIVAKDDIE